MRDLTAVNSLVILLKLDSNRRFFSLCDLEILWMTLKNNGAPLLYYVKLCASFQIHQWIQTGVTVQKRSNQVEIGNFLSCVTLKLGVCPSKTIGLLFYTPSSFVHHFKASVNSNCSYSRETPNLGQNQWFFCPVWPSNLMDDLEKQ